MTKPLEHPDSIQLEMTPQPIEVRPGLEAGKGDDQWPKLKLLANTGIPMNARGFYDPVILDMSGVVFSAKRIPILGDHRTSLRLGYTSSQEIDGDKNIVAEAVASGTSQEAKDMIADMQNGIPFQVSVGASIKKSQFIDEDVEVEVNGKMHKGPLLVAKATTVNEITVTIFGADPKTSAKIAASHTGRDPMLKKWLIAQFGESYEQDLSTEELQAAKSVWEEMSPADRVKSSINLGADPNKATPPPRPGAKSDEDLRAAKNREDLDLAAAQEERLDDIRGLFRSEDYADLFDGTDDDLKLTGPDGKEVTPKTFKSKAIKLGWSNDQVELSLMRASRSQPSAAPAMHVVDKDTNATALEISLLRSLGKPAHDFVKYQGQPIKDHPIARADISCHRAGTEYGWETGYSIQELEASDLAQHKNMSLHKLLDINLRATGKTPGIGGVRSELTAAWNSVKELQAASGGYSTISVANILENVANKIALYAYLSQETVWQNFAAIRTMNDFKTHSIYRLDNTGRFKKVGPDGELQHGALADNKDTLRLDTYGQILAINRQMSRDDDLSGFDMVGTMLGRNAAVAVESAFFVVLLGNSGSHFAAGNNNLQSGASTDMDLTGVGLAVAGFHDFVDSKGDPVLISPDRILVGTQDRVGAEDVFKGTTLITGNTTARTDVNVHSGLYRPYASPYLNNTNVTNHQDGAAITGQTTDIWFISGSPQQLAAVNAGFLDGNQTPTIETFDVDPSRLGMQTRAYLDFAMAFGDEKGMIQMAGA